MMVILLKVIVLQVGLMLRKDTILFCRMIAS